MEFKITINRRIFCRRSCAEAFGAQASLLRIFSNKLNNQLENIMPDYQRLALENEKDIDLIQGCFFNCWSNGQGIIIEMKERAACYLFEYFPNRKSEATAAVFASEGV
ncbi:hypothetical protein AB4Z45_26030 [Paenibacillus sp. MCAF9]|uniref:hypothetical protein n=1 Tax=unclassified Paenibacillus TaxID=185978 RepID=UPI003F981D93